MKKSISCEALWNYKRYIENRKLQIEESSLTGKRPLSQIVTDKFRFECIFSFVCVA